MLKASSMHVRQRWIMWQLHFTNVIWGNSAFIRATTLCFSPNMTLQASDEYPMIFSNRMFFSWKHCFMAEYKVFASHFGTITMSRKAVTTSNVSWSKYTTQIASCFSDPTSVVSSGIMLNFVYFKWSTKSLGNLYPRPCLITLVHFVAHILSCFKLVSFIKLTNCLEIEKGRLFCAIKAQMRLLVSMG